MVPDLYELILLALAAYRTWRLLAEDAVLDWPRRRILRMGNWRKEGDPYPPKYREAVGDFVGCPACLGFWISLFWFVAWAIFPYETLVVAAVASISALVIFQRQKLDPPE